MKVGFIGLGQIGAPMAEHLADWPDGLVVHDARPEATAAIAERGATVVETPAAVGAAAGLVSVMVRDDQQVWEVLTGADGILAAARPGTVVAVHSTIGDGTAEQLAAAAAPSGVAVVDAPVSGGFMGAKAGNLAVLVGGDAEAVAVCREPFGRFAGLVAHLGPVGAGTRAKLARNLLHFVAFAAAGEAQRLAEAAAIDLTELAKVVRHTDAITGGPGAVMVRSTSLPMASDDPLRAIFTHTRELGEKDLRLAIELGANLGVDLPLAERALVALGAALGVPSEEQR